MSKEIVVCFRCRLELTENEVKENTEEEPTCRKCTAMQNRLQDFRAHMDDDNYFMPDGHTPEIGPKGVPIWEWYAYRIIKDFEDTPILVEDLEDMDGDRLETEDYRKIIELLTDALFAFKYSQEYYELPK